MLAFARGLMAQPQLLMLDEPSLGLAPKLVAEVYADIRRVAQTGKTVLIARGSEARVAGGSSRGPTCLSSLPGGGAVSDAAGPVRGRPHTRGAWYRYLPVSTKRNLIVNRP